MDTAFVTGGTGFVGANLVRLLLDKGLAVRALARKGSNLKNLEGLPVEVFEGDLRDAGRLAAACRGARYVFHMAADYRIWVPDPGPMADVNIEGTRRLIEAAAKSGAQRIVHCSSVAAVRPEPHGQAADETSHYADASEIIGPYKKSKWLSEQVALEAARKGAPVVVVNPAAPIGPHDIKPTPTGRIVTDFLNGRLPCYIDTGFNVVHVRDVALGHYLAALHGRVGERYILGGENLSLKRVLDVLAEETGLPAPRFKTPYAVAYGFAAFNSLWARLSGSEPLAPLDAVRMARHPMYFSSSKAEGELGYPSSSAREALRDAARWFLDNSYVRNSSTRDRLCARLRETAKPAPIAAA